MSFWTSFRDSVESAASVAGNFFLPGSGLLTSHLTSKGSQNQLGSTLGQIALLGSGVGGGLSGNMSNYGSFLSGMTSGPAAPVSEMSFNAGSFLPGEGSGDISVAQQLIQNGVDPGQALQMAGFAPGDPSAQALLTSMQNARGGSFGPGAGVGGVGGGAGNMPWGSPSNLLTIGSGLYGLSEAQRLKQLAQGLSSQADPFGPFRGQYAQQLSALSADPTLIQKQPGYQAGLDAVQRSMAAQGYTGSGNMMAAIAKYGGDFYNQTLDRFSGLAGAGFNPAAGAQLNLEGQIGSAQLAGSSLNRLAYGTYMAGR